MSRSAFASPAGIHVRTTLPSSTFISRVPPDPVSPARSTPRAKMATAPSKAPPTPPQSSKLLALFQCPSCETPHPPIAPLKLSDFPDACTNCGSKVIQRDGYIDLTPNPDSSTSLLRNFITQRTGQSLFQLPQVSFAYERGWRSSFNRAGFPGIDKEYDMFLDFAAPASTVLDLSCGTGLMARRLATSGQFEYVIAADYSEAMLRETVARARRDVKVPEFDVIRADVAALPFVEGALDAVHSGAAIHCWPNVQDGLAEVFRVLKPGGRFFATTFLKLPYMIGRERLKDRKRLMNALVLVNDLVLGSDSYRFYEDDELEFLFKAAGFVDVNVETNRGCAIIRAWKP
eukprot:GFKZ01011674.1.p1 GENE.GFKZ01011674.1~~GFKZ01011674.1.p1  ORF type:complete len:345 (-),score=41.50 GFKZ01011674.1:2495-3529(-)